MSEAVTIEAAQQEQQDIDRPQLEGVYVMTNCSVSKMIEPKAKIKNMGTNLSMAEALNEWVGIIESFPTDTTPIEFHRGASFHTIQSMFPLVGRDHIRVFGGGQGLLTLDTPIVPYDFSVIPKEEYNIHQHVTREPFIQPLWWRMVNKRLRGSDTPARDLLAQEDVKLVIVACYKFFVKYLTDDLLSCTRDQLSKLRIINTSSHHNWLPMQFRPYAIDAPREVVYSAVGNRNNIAHRAGLKFLEMLVANPELIGQPAAVQQKKLIEIHGPRSVGYSTMMSRSHEISPLPTTAITKGQEAAALIALNSIMPDLERRSGRAARASGTDEIVRDVMVFVKLLRDLQYKDPFSTREISAWVKSYYDSQEKDAPAWADSRQQIAQSLAAAYRAMGLIKFKIPGAGMVMYRLDETKVETVEDEDEIDLEVEEEAEDERFEE
jgi:hypothetical protein